jgi:predicted membrane protein
MMNQTKHLFSGKVIVGFFILLVGILSLLDNFNVSLPFDPWDVWPVLLVFAGVAMLVNSGGRHNVLTGLVLIVIGAILSANNMLPGFNIRLSLLWPLILVIIGFRFIVGSHINAKDTAKDQNFINITAILGGGDYQFSSKTISGGEVTAMLGGADIDLRQSDFEQETLVLDIFAFCGGVDIKVPRNWQVTLQGTPLLGGMDNKTQVNVNGIDGSPVKPIKKVLVRGNAIMGGIEIKN